MRRTVEEEGVEPRISIGDEEQQAILTGIKEVDKSEDVNLVSIVEEGGEVVVGKVVIYGEAVELEDIVDADIKVEDGIEVKVSEVDEVFEVVTGGGIAVVDETFEFMIWELFMEGLMQVGDMEVNRVVEEG